MARYLLLLVALGLAATRLSASAAVITTAEYFIDVDPGQGKGTVVQAGSPGATSAFVINIPRSTIAALTEGVHTLACRVKDDAGNWSIAFYRTFFKEGPAEIDTTPPTATISAVTPDPRDGSVGSLSIAFSEPVTGFTVADLILTRNGGGNLLTPSQNLTTSDNTNFVLDGLTEITGLEGTYALALRAADSGITDTAGNLLATDSVETWSVDRTPPTATIAAVTPDPRNNVVDNLRITFSEAVSGLDLGDLALTRNGGVNLLSASQTLSTADNRTFVLSGLNALTAADGAYSFTLRAANSGIADSAGNLLAGDAVESWTTDRTPPTATISAVMPDPRNSAVATVNLIFSEPVVGLDLADLTLSRNGSANLFDGAQTLTTIDNASFVLSGLTASTETDGSYTLTLRAASSGIADFAGNPLQTDAAETWAVDRTPPTAQIAAVLPNPRNSPVDTISILFSEAVSGFNLSDLVLTRNAGANLLNGSERLTSSDNTSFTLSGIAGLTDTDGSYVLTLKAANSGISDHVGNLLSADARVAWGTDRTPPTVNIIAVAPDPRNSALSSISIVFSEPVTGLNLPDLALTRSSGPNLLTGSQTLTTADNITFQLSGLAELTKPDGIYTLALRAGDSGIIDVVGNSLTSDAATTWTMAADLIVVGEYFIDVDPGPGKGIPIAIASPVWPLSLSVNIPASVIGNLPDGPHFLTCRVRDETGNWSVAFSRVFHKENPQPVSAAVVEFIEMQWFLDGAAVSAPVLARASAPAREVSLALTASIAGLAKTGTYQLLVTPIDSLGNRGAGVSRPVFVDPGTIPPEPLNVSAFRRLPDGSLQLAFSGEMGRSYILQASTDLTQWINLRTGLSGNSTVALTGAEAAFPKRFFRLRAE